MRKIHRQWLVCLQTVNMAVGLLDLHHMNVTVIKDINWIQMERHALVSITQY